MGCTIALRVLTSRGRSSFRRDTPPDATNWICPLPWTSSPPTTSPVGTQAPRSSIAMRKSSASSSTATSNHWWEILFTAMKRIVPSLCIRRSSRKPCANCTTQNVLPMNLRGWAPSDNQLIAIALLLLWHEYCFPSRKSVQRRFVQMQVRRDKFRRRVRQPFGKRQILIVAALKHLEELQVGRAGVFDIVGQSFLHIADIPRFEIHGAGAASR